MSPGVTAFIRLVKHPVKFRMFLLLKLPAAYFTGVRVREVSEGRCVTTVPYKWLSRNPFRSAYFASLAMAAEMSTGTLALAHVYKRQPSVAVILVKVEGEYFKKATRRTIFVCEDGELIEKAVEESVSTGEGKTARVRSIGRDKDGELIAEFFITWSFKIRNKK